MQSDKPIQPIMKITWCGPALDPRNIHGTLSNEASTSPRCSYRPDLWPDNQKDPQPEPLTRQYDSDKGERHMSCGWNSSFKMSIFFLKLTFQLWTNETFAGQGSKFWVVKFNKRLEKTVNRSSGHQLLIKAFGVTLLACLLRTTHHVTRKTIVKRGYIQMKSHAVFSTL